MALEFATSELGLRPWEFWQLTYAELQIMAEGYRKAQINRANELMSLAWHTAAMSRLRGKDFPKLESLLQKHTTGKKIKEQTPEEMLEMFKIITAALGGKVVKQK